MKSKQFIEVKSNKELNIMRKGGRILAEILEKLIDELRIEITGLDIENLAIKLTKQYNVKPAFLNFNGYPFSTCISVNNCVVHGLPNNEKFKNNDLISIDFGIIFNNFYLDSARSKIVGKATQDTTNLIKWTKQSFYEGIKGIKPGSHIGDIGYNIENFANKYSLGIIKDLCGHGIGKSLQEFPNIFNYGNFGSGVILEKGNVLAVEPMLTLGSDKVTTSSDGWSVFTKDGSLAAHYENTIIITENGAEVITDNIS